MKALGRIGGGLAAIALVVTWGAVGYVLAGWSLSDAFFMVVITISTVGFGEVRPLVSGWLRFHTILVIALGYVTVGYTLACLVAFITEEELKRFMGSQRVKRQIDALNQHVIVVGLGRMGMQLCIELDAAGLPFVVIDRSPEKLAEIERKQWLTVMGDATEEQTLEDAGLMRARAIVAAIPDDAVNVFITLTAHDLAPGVQIFARAEEPSTRRKLERAGAHHVVLPAAIGANRVVSLLTNPGAVKFAELVTRHGTLEIEMEEIEVPATGPLMSKTLRDLDIGRRTGVVVIAVKRADGHVEFPAVGVDPLRSGDRLVLLGRSANLEHFRREFQS